MIINRSVTETTAQMPGSSHVFSGTGHSLSRAATPSRRREDYEVLDIPAEAPIDEFTVPAVTARESKAAHYHLGSLTSLTHQGKMQGYRESRITTDKPLPAHWAALGQLHFEKNTLDERLETLRTEKDELIRAEIPKTTLQYQTNKQARNVMKQQRLALIGRSKQMQNTGWVGWAAYHADRSGHYVAPLVKRGLKLTSQALAAIAQDESR